MGNFRGPDCLSRTLRKFTEKVVFCSAFLLLVLVGTTGSALAQINPWIQSDLYNPAKWDTAGPQTATPWLHPETWTPGQE